MVCELKAVRRVSSEDATSTPRFVGLERRKRKVRERRRKKAA